MESLNMLSPNKNNSIQIYISLLIIYEYVYIYKDSIYCYFYLDYYSLSNMKRRPETMVDAEITYLRPFI
jgi:hypothetical protein